MADVSAAIADQIYLEPPAVGLWTMFENNENWFEMISPGPEAPPPLPPLANFKVRRDGEWVDVG